MAMVLLQAHGSEDEDDEEAEEEAPADAFRL
eukprot:CAMPEP_0174293874 /NCGR_PEP_ID=MMETSP0809-20121228/39950_1 /TAXON_ID=73025 ORGANISM="Eutreptiella gymnastica-like, Strain CCMP1594" /NCGR_SAMPLE_ID=MMETSP0809 /ASSEMBLY_ACC=CAM_ASM_000658 /LENGTH=30 /DNA_ID= /DNA_START= /DNA_END= /DNA_ORIENTATION=